MGEISLLTHLRSRGLAYFSNFLEALCCERLVRRSTKLRTSHRFHSLVPFHHSWTSKEK